MTDEKYSLCFSITLDVSQTFDTLEEANKILNEIAFNESVDLKHFDIHEVTYKKVILHPKQS